MTSLVIAFHIGVSVLIILAVLFQSGKGASIGASFGGGSSNQTLFGSSGPASFLAKITVVLGIAFGVTSMYLTYESTRVGPKSIMDSVPSLVEEQKAAPVATDENK